MKVERAREIVEAEGAVGEMLGRAQVARQDSAGLGEAASRFVSDGTAVVTQALRKFNEASRLLPSEERLAAMRLLALNVHELSGAVLASLDRLLNEVGQ